MEIELIERVRVWGTSFKLLSTNRDGFQVKAFPADVIKSSLKIKTVKFVFFFVNPYVNGQNPPFRVGYIEIERS